jgi:uncharacterized protein with von Willebrand factor type A (vWA) domain
MDRFIALENINHFRERLMSEINTTLRSTLQRLLLQEEDKLAKDLGLLDDLAREIVHHVSKAGRRHETGSERKLRKLELAIWAAVDFQEDRPRPQLIAGKQHV